MVASFVEYSRIKNSMAKILPPPPPKSNKYTIGVITVGQSHYYAVYNKSICQIDIDCSSGDITSVIDILNHNLDTRMQLWVMVPISRSNFISCVQHFADNGFTNPYITGKTIFGKKIQHSVALSRRNTTGVSFNAQRTLLNVMYILQQYRSLGCSMYAQFNHKAISFLRKTSGMGHTKNGDGKISQKELGGALHVEKIVKERGKIVFVMGVHEHNVSPGSEEEIHISATRYNFHSHPEEAYVRHGVTKAWPSLTDFLGYLKLGNETIFHCVASIEGIYIMSFGEYWVNHLSKISKKFIETHYDIDHARKMTPFQFTVFVNRIKYKGYPIYKVKFIPWGVARTIFSVTYKKDGLTCSPSEKITTRKD